MKLESITVEPYYVTPPIISPINCTYWQAICRFDQLAREEDQTLCGAVLEIYDWYLYHTCMTKYAAYTPKMSYQVAFYFDCYFDAKKFANRWDVG